MDIGAKVYAVRVADGAKILTGLELERPVSLNFPSCELKPQSHMVQPRQRIGYAREPYL